MKLTAKFSKVYDPTQDPKLKGKDLFIVSKLLERYSELSSSVTTDFKSDGKLFLKFIGRIPFYRTAIEKINADWTVMNQIQTEYRDLISPEQYQSVIQNINLYNNIVKEYSLKITKEAEESRERIAILQKELRTKTSFIRKDPVYLVMTMPVECLPYKYQVEAFKEQEKLLRGYESASITKEEYRVDLNKKISEIKSRILKDIKEGVGPNVMDFMLEAQEDIIE